MSTWLVLGLGNPGPSYQRTRHNVGFWVIDRLCERHRLAGYKDKFGALWTRGTIAQTDVVLGMPQTYMNKSGEPGQALASFFKVPVEQVVVMHDELDFLPGIVRVKKGGGAGGHNGLRSLISTLGADFVRVRMGVGKPPSAEEGANYVLNAPRKEEQVLLDEAVEVAADAVEAILSRGVTEAMNRVNGKK